MTEFSVNALHGLVQGWNATPRLSQNWTWGSDSCLNNWTVVSCFQESVTSLRLDQFGIIGTLSPSIGQLKNLQLKFLNLQNNPGPTGPIPKKISQLCRLYALDYTAFGTQSKPSPELSLCSPEHMHLYVRILRPSEAGIMW
ncbi:hypothetical protein KC19_9G054600 [Ceratodon purpureus]|uniref:Leucine-rich repeat-containing N-terminal plant-type domain-containing protein n=1 Tax=Ceratodon purpureus TaxID=3225 RepID=A0A8T0GSB3_CERPU|nr:hypothetical protein KC19_9G054600 [Ceratodon purpureus]